MNSPNNAPSRRKFLQTAAVGAVLGPYTLVLGGRAVAAGSRGAPAAGWPNFAKGEVVRTGGQLTADGRFVETQRALPIAGRSDVLIVGGGPAGIGAALAAARAGAKTQLIETAGCLGGVWTAGMLTKIIDGGNKPGIMKEILAAMVARGSLVAKQTQGAIYDPELMKLVLEEMCVTAGIKIRLHTHLVGAVTDQRNRLVAVVTESKSGRQAWVADRFIDCSGDGDLAAQAGCRFDVGATADCECQPMSLMALLAGVNTELVPEFIREIGGGEAKTRFYELMKQSGINPSYRQPTLRHLHSGIFSLMTNHEYGVPAYDADQISVATIRARAEIHAIVAGLRRIGGPWKDVAVVATAEQIGIREGRRVRGRQTVTAADLAQGKKSDDGVCRVTFGIDVHDVWSDSTNPKGADVMENVRRARKQGVKPYDIPLPALIAGDVDGLMMAGRCISGDFIAHASYRVTGNAVPMGEAAGLASAVSLKKGVLPHELSWREIKAT
ncbi:MAG: FAD-dependent oxidoreductase [Verrucomicrobia bacterium]|nr:FAD-dependent oxidoreductase [Verrucomicrobiota bacterium]